MVPHISVSVLLRSIRRLFVATLIALAVLAAIGAAIVAQAGRDEAASADTAVLMLDGSDGGEATRIERTLRLYLGGQISRVVLAGSNPGSARDALISRGVVPDKIVEVRSSTELGQIEDVQQLVQEAHIADIMLIGEPVEALRLLKIARDRGLTLRSAPAGADTSISIGSVVDEIGRYLVYCFAGR